MLHSQLPAPPVRIGLQLPRASGSDGSAVKRPAKLLLYLALRALLAVGPLWRAFEGALVRLGHRFPTSRVTRVLTYHVARSVVAWRPADAERIAVLAGGARLWVTLADYWFHGHLYFDGIHIHQPHVAPLLRRLLRPDDVVLDVGAHLGYYACLAAARGARVHAFEPHPELASRLRRSRDLNGFGGRLQVVQQAVADVDGAGVLFMDQKAPDEAGDSAGSGASILPLPRFETRTALDTTFLRLDTYCRRHDIGSIRLLLVDAQGAEPRVLAGAQRLLTEVRPEAIICVVSGLTGASTPAEVLDPLRSAGYVPYEIAAGGLVPFDAAQTLEAASPWRLRDVCFLRAEDEDAPRAFAAPTAAPPPPARDRGRS